MAEGGKLPELFADGKPLIFHVIDSIAYCDTTLRQEDKDYIHLILDNGGRKQLNCVYQNISPLLQLIIQRMEPFVDLFYQEGARLYFFELPEVFARIVRGLYRALQRKKLSTCENLLSILHEKSRGYIEKNQAVMMSKFADDLYYGDYETNENILLALQEYGVNIYEILQEESFISLWGKRFGAGFTAFTLLFINRQEQCLQHFTRDWKELLNMHNHHGDHILHIMAEHFQEDFDKEEEATYLENIQRICKVVGAWHQITNAQGETPIDIAKRKGFSKVCACFGEIRK